MADNNKSEMDTDEGENEMHKKTETQRMGKRKVT